MHTQYTNLRCAHTTCRYACITSSSHCPKDQSEWMSPQGDFPPSHTFEKDFEVPLGNKYKGQMGEPLPTSQGPWGTLHQILILSSQGEPERAAH